MGEWQQQTKMGFDVETVLSQLTQNEKIALLSGESSSPIEANPNEYSVAK